MCTEPKEFTSYSEMSSIVTHLSATVSALTESTVSGVLIIADLFGFVP